MKIRLHEIMEGQSPEKVKDDCRAQRMMEYPSVVEQLDMIWHSIDQDQMIGKDSKWYKDIKTIKDDNPVNNV